MFFSAQLRKILETKNKPKEKPIEFLEVKPNLSYKKVANCSVPCNQCYGKLILQAEVLPNGTEKVKGYQCQDCFEWITFRERKVSKQTHYNDLRTSYLTSRIKCPVCKESNYLNKRSYWNYNFVNNIVSYDCSSCSYSYKRTREEIKTKDKNKYTRWTIYMNFMNEFKKCKTKVS